MRSNNNCIFAPLFFLHITVQKGHAVAFTAILSKHTVVSSKAIVKYDHILSNVGGAYHPSTGIFTAPYKGIYSISCSLLSETSNDVHLQITKNGAKMSILYSGRILTQDRPCSYCWTKGIKSGSKITKQRKPSFMITAHIMCFLGLL